MARKLLKTVKLRLYDNDADLVNWLDAFESHGAQTLAMRIALRSYAGLETPPGMTPPPHETQMLLAQIAEAMEQMLIAIEANQAGNIDQAEPPEVAANLDELVERLDNWS